MNTMSTLNTFLLINHTNAILIERHCIYRTRSLTWTHQISNGVIWTCLRTKSTFFTLTRIDVSTVFSHRDRTKAARLLTGSLHTLTTVICYYITCNGTLLTSRRNNLNHAVTLLITRAFTLCQTHTLADNFPLFINTATKSCFWSRNHLEWKKLLPLLKFLIIR